MLRAKVNIPKKQIAAFCHRHGIKKMSLFGSVLREDFNSSSDVDVLVEFKPDKKIGLIRLSGLELELGEILGRKVDLNTPGLLSKYYRDQVLAQAEVMYDAT
jgi:predicted nucleotidyltransferase